jgi:hypothetical protein
VLRPDRILFGVSIVALLVVAVLLALVGAFYSPYDAHLLGIAVPVGVLIAIFGNLALGVGSAWGTGSRIGPAVTGTAWFVVAFVLGNKRPEGDLVVPGSGWHGIAFLFLGVAAAAVAVGIGPPGQRRRPQPASSLEAASRR